MRIEDLVELQKCKCTRLEQVNKITCYLLEKGKCLTPTKTKHAKEIFQEYEELKEKYSKIPDVPSNTFGVMLSILSQSFDSPIKSQGRKLGYYLDNAAGTSLPSKRANKLSEKDLYPILEEWLESDAYVIRNMANKRKGNKWQNVDVLGWSFIRHLEKEFLELHSIEVKLSLANWRIDLFEAVSHSMFANKSYFAFLIKESDKIEKALKEYAYKFGIGLLAIVVDNDAWDNVIQNKVVLDASDDGNCSIVEISIAPRRDVDLETQNMFMVNVLNVHNSNELRKNS